MRYPNWGLAVLVLTLLGVSSCRTDKPPILSEICILDGLGGGDCALPDGTSVYRSPSALKNYWATTQTDEANFASWCYKTTPAVAETQLERIKSRILTDASDGAPRVAPEVVWEQRGAHAQ